MDYCFGEDMPSNNEPSMIRPTLINLSPVELNYYPFLITLGKCSGSCNAADDLPSKNCSKQNKRGKC